MANEGWPMGMNFYQASRQRPFPPLTAPPLTAPRHWGVIEPTTLFRESGVLRVSPVPSMMAIRGTQGAARCHPARDAGQTEAEVYRQQIAPTAPKYFREYLLAGQDAPEPGSAEYMQHIRPRFVSRTQEQTYVD